MTDLSIDARLPAPDNDRHSANLTIVAIAAATLLAPTLYTAGGGNTRMLVTLAAFIAGSTLGALQGAYFSGIASGSLHGWCWLVAAFLGNIVGTQLRPLFGLAVEREPAGGAKR
jgi:hypothetical protein